MCFPWFLLRILEMTDPLQDSSEGSEPEPEPIMKMPEKQGFPHSAYHTNEDIQDPDPTPIFPSPGFSMWKEESPLLKSADKKPGGPSASPKNTNINRVESENSSLGVLYQSTIDSTHQDNQHSGKNGRPATFFIS